MGEITEVPQATPSKATHDVLNFLDVHKPDAHKQEQSFGAGRKEIFPDLVPAANGSARSATGCSQAGGLQSTRRELSETKSENQALDLSGALYPGEKNQAKGLDANSLPKNKYETEITAQLTGLASEAAFTRYTQTALQRDADKFPPVRNDKNGTTTYTIEQIGLTDRDLKAGENTADHFKRLVKVTVPDDADSLQKCKFEFGDRHKIDVKEFDSLVARDQKRQSDLSAASPEENKLSRAQDMSFYTHGIRTGAESADFMALALQLTNGHSVINIDWKSAPPSEEKTGISETYQINRKGAAESYGKFEKELDQTIGKIGAEHTDMIAFSHGAMFDTKYLMHRKETHAPLLNEIILAHPDVPIATLAQPNQNGIIDEANRLYSKVAKNTHVIGSPTDLAMTGAAYNDCDTSKCETLMDRWKEHDRQMGVYARLGNGAAVSRTLVAGHGGTYVMENIPKDKAEKDPYHHFVNMQAISSLINGVSIDNTTKLANLEKTGAAK
jgi:hypothetical protein